MNTQRHVIKRQVIELTAPGGKDCARGVQDEISRIYRQRIIPLLDRQLSGLSGPDRIIRIDSLELNLGVLDTERLEDDFTAKVEAALNHELDKHLRQAEQNAETLEGGIKGRSHLELLVYFLKTGAVPWWADIARPGLLKDTLDGLLTDAPRSLVRALKALIPKAEARTRLVRHYGDGHLQRVLDLLVPSFRNGLGTDVPTLRQALGRVRSLGTVSRDRLWDSLFETALSCGHDPVTLVKAAIQQMAGSPDGTDPIKEVLNQILEANGASGRVLRRILRDEGPRVMDQDHPHRGLKHRPGRTKGNHRFQDGAPIGPSPDNPDGSDGNNNTVSAGTDSPGATHAGQSDQPGKNDARDEGIRDTRSPLFRAGQKPSPAWTGQDGHDAMDLSFAQSESYPVLNAGLVIVWPFLAQFFIRTKLVDDARNFRGVEARHRGTVLLQAVAANDIEPPEYLLPLNKILCGLDAETVIECDTPVTDDESLECETFLQAVIARAPILRDMTPDGFRGSFLVRSGMLSHRDGLPLLRVERKTFDIVLDRFPWSWEWVKLPWMNTALRVEWE